MLDISLDDKVAVIIFTLVLGGFAALGVAWVDKLSRLLFSLMILLLVVVVMFLMSDIAPATLMQKSLAGDLTESWMAAIPVVFTSFGFHVCIATLVRYLDGDLPSLRKVLLIGSTIPLGCYILWLLVTLGTVGGQQIDSFNGSLPELVVALQQIADNSIISKAISLFADLALVTSFLGVTLSLYDFIAELIRASNDFSGRVQTWLLTFIPPLMCALFIPEGFVTVLGFAAVPLVVMIVFLPIVMALQQRVEQPQGYQVLGGKSLMLMAGVMGLIVVAAQLWVAL